MQKSLLWKIALIGLVVVLLQIPVEMIRGLVAERKQARDGVVADIARGSSDAQRIVGPILYVPWTRRVEETTTVTDEAGRIRTSRKDKVESGQVAFLPELLLVEGTIDLQEKHRSLYKAHVYTLRTVLRGSFVLPSDFGVPAGSGTLVWGRAMLVIGIQDTRGIRDNLRLDWSGAAVSLQPGGLEAAGLPGGVHADLGRLATASEGGARALDFRITLSLLGTERLEIVPLGRTTEVSLSSAWPHPSFIGRVLPGDGTRIAQDGFKANWRTSHFSTNLAQLHQRCLQSRQCDAFQQYTLGVSFVQPVDLYQTVERAVKYGFLFVGLTFAALFLFEVLAGLAIHPLQYALTGLALAVFFLLLLSLSEHLGFAYAYAIATGACVALTGYYVGHVLQSVRRGAAFGAALAALYGLLYVLLRSEDHALLAGSLLVFACLSAAMVATRKVDWFKVGVELR